MNSKQAHQLLHQVMYLDPTHTPSESPSTFLVVETVRYEKGVHVTTLIVDPSMPDNGDAAAYLELEPVQRLALELAETLNTVASGVSAVTQHAPLDKELWEQAQNDKNSLVKAVRAMAAKAAVVCLEGNLPKPLQEGTVQ
jgi:hypothetical protein